LRGWPEDIKATFPCAPLGDSTANAQSAALAKAVMHEISVLMASEPACRTKLW
jgi:hypothetical protein